MKSQWRRAASSPQAPTAARASASLTASSRPASASRAPQAIVVEQARGGAQPVGHGVAAGPAGDVVERAGGGEAVGHEGRDDLPVAEPGAPAHGAGAIDDAHQAEPLEHRGDEGQRADQVAPGRRVEPGEGARQVVQRARRLEPVAPAQVRHHPVAHLALVVPEALHDVHVLVYPAALPDPLEAHIHFPYRIGRPLASVNASPTSAAYTLSPTSTSSQE